MSHRRSILSASIATTIAMIATTHVTAPAHGALVEISLNSFFFNLPEGGGANAAFDVKNTSGQNLVMVGPTSITATFIDASDPFHGVAGDADSAEVFNGGGNCAGIVANNAKCTFNESITTDPPGNNEDDDSGITKVTTNVGFIVPGETDITEVAAPAYAVRVFDRPIPEPATWFAFAAGLMGLAGARVKRAVAGMKL